MTEGDFGVEIDIALGGISLGSSDTVRMTVKKSKNGSTVLEKELEKSEDETDTVTLCFDEDESMMLKVGSYVYALDWYNGDQFMYNIVNNAKLKVEDKI